MNYTTPVLIGVVGALSLFGIVKAVAFESLYGKTPVGTVEVKTLPERVSLTSTTTGTYFEKDNRLFTTLFDYIKKNDVAMTVPVEAEIDDGEMRFFAGGKDASRELASTTSVSVETLPSRDVVSVGISGAYTEDRYKLGVKKLEAWMAEHPEYEAVGPAYAVYWNGPYVPRFWKRSEVHLPVRRVSETVAEAAR